MACLGDLEFQKLLVGKVLKSHLFSIASDIGCYLFALGLGLANRAWAQE